MAKETRWLPTDEEIQKLSDVGDPIEDGIDIGYSLGYKSGIKVGTKFTAKKIAERFRQYRLGETRSAYHFEIPIKDWQSLLKEIERQNDA